jgi:hypothetical protein
MEAGMKPITITALFLISVSAFVLAQQPPPQGETFYHQSLHYTNRGIEFVYSKEHGGLERLTGLSAAQMNCAQSKCHVTTCDQCHKKEVDDKAFYTTDATQIQEACQKCHPVAKDDPDVHFSRGMKCMDCHTAREIHGDGIPHKTYMEPGFFDTRCENCHGQIAKTVSHTIHKGKLDCIPCHVIEMPTCINCHIDTRLAGGKGTSIELKNMYFLVNHDGRVRLANFLSYVYGNKTMITLAPSFNHSIKKQGRNCSDCHKSQIVKDISKNKFFPIRWEKGAVKNVEGVIPVLEGMKWNIAFLTKKDDQWTPLQNPEQPLLNYSGYCTPLTQTQFDKLLSGGTPK